ncbi:MAG: hypothetical protein WCL08_06705, partial [Verrucomicrobiota bacterium]
PSGTAGFQPASYFLRTHGGLTKQLNAGGTPALLEDLMVCRGFSDAPLGATPRLAPDKVTL